MAFHQSVLLREPDEFFDIREISGLGDHGRGRIAVSLHEDSGGGGSSLSPKYHRVRLARAVGLGA